jgi:hypothetical protein
MFALPSGHCGQILCQEYLSPSENSKIGDIVQIKEYMGKAINLEILVETFQGKQLLFLMEVFQIRSKTTRFYKRRFDLSGVLW